jgi:hypothetical protein
MLMAIHGLRCVFAQVVCTERVTQQTFSAIRKSYRFGKERKPTLVFVCLKVLGADASAVGRDPQFRDEIGLILG